MTSGVPLDSAAHVERMDLEEEPQPVPVLESGRPPLLEGVVGPELRVPPHREQSRLLRRFGTNRHLGRGSALAGQRLDVAQQGKAELLVGRVLLVVNPDARRIDCSYPRKLNQVD